MRQIKPGLRHQDLEGIRNVMLSSVPAGVMRKIWKMRHVVQACVSIRSSVTVTP
jgi:hypothetical protein